MNNEKFIEKVEMMREAQKQYFKSRDNRILMRCLNLEKLVDDMIIEHKFNDKLKVTQLELFPPQPTESEVF